MATSSASTMASPSPVPAWCRRSGSAYVSQGSCNQADYAGHSLRIGAVTIVAARGVPAEVIMTLGRWKSAAYKLYIRLPRDQLAGISQALARQGVARVDRTEK